VKRFFLWIKIRALEATAQGQQDVLALVSDTERRGRIQVAHMGTLAEITRLKSEYRRLQRGAGIRAITAV